MRILDHTSKVLAHSLNLRQLRQEIIASNIANSETPGYKAKRLDFEEALSESANIGGQGSLKVTDNQHFAVGSGGLETLQPQIYEDPNGIVSEDGNTVDRDAEFAEMAENKILYDASVQLLNKKISLLKYAIMNER